jgi:hypothetical protein
MRCRGGVGLVVASVLYAQIAFASSIGVFFAPDGSDCDGTASPGVPFTVYVGAVLGGDAAAGGITGAEFRMDGADLAWARTVTPSHFANLALGNPVTGGCNIAFSTCQPGPYVHLYTIEFSAVGPISPTTFVIRQHCCTPNTGFLCSLVTRCDAPVFTKVCVSGGQAFLNDPTRACTVAVERQSWSAIKVLFQ